MARKHTPLTFQLIDVTLNQMTFAVQMFIVGAWVRALGARRNYRLRPLRFDLCHERIRVIALVGDDIVALEFLDQLRCGRQIVGVARREAKAHAQAKSIGSQV